MKSLKPAFLTLEAELKADISTLSDLAEVSLKTLRQYQNMLITLQREKPCPRWASHRLLFVCKEARHAYQEASRTIAKEQLTLAAMQHAREGSA